MTNPSKILPWTKAAKTEVMADLSLLFAAILRNGEEVMCDLEGLLDDGSSGRSRFSANFPQSERSDAAFNLTLSLARPDRFQVAPPQDGQPYRTNLLTHYFLSEHYSEHERLHAWSQLPSRLIEVGIASQQIDIWLAPHRSPHS